MVCSNYKLLTKIIHFGIKWGGHIWFYKFHGSLIIATFKKVFHKRWLWLIRWLWGTQKKNVCGSNKSRQHNQLTHKVCCQLLFAPHMLLYWSLKGHFNLISVSKEDNVKWSDEFDPHLRLRKHLVLIFWKAYYHKQSRKCSKMAVLQAAVHLHCLWCWGSHWRHGHTIDQQS